VDIPRVSASHHRITVIGNAGGGKSTLSRLIAASRSLPYIEIDRFLWQADWQPTAAEHYAVAHDQALASPRWVIDGLGRRESIPARLQRSTEIILIDLPLWAHFWLAAERQIAWSQNQIEHPPAGALKAPPTEALFRAIWDVDQFWMADLRQLIDKAEVDDGKPVTRLETLDDLKALHDSLQAHKGDLGLTIQEAHKLHGNA